MSMAGGWNVGGNLRQAVIFRRGDDWRLMATLVDIRGALYGKVATPADELWLNDSDVLVVPKAPIRVFDDYVNIGLTQGLYSVAPFRSFGAFHVFHAGHAPARSCQPQVLTNRDVSRRVLPLKQSVVAVQRRHAVRFRHRRIVKRGVDEVQQRVGLALLRHDRLADVDDFGCVGPETVDAQHLKRLAVE